MVPFHPSDNPAAAPLWEKLFALVNGLAGFMRLGGPQGGQALVPTWRQVRGDLQAAERQLRQLLLAPAEALLAQMPDAPPASHGPNPRAVPKRQRPARRRATRQLFRLETGTSAHRRPSGPRPYRPRLDDHCGTRFMPLTGEIHRYARLVTTIENPDPTIRRLAHLLKRRRRKERARRNAEGISVKGLGCFSGKGARRCSRAKARGGCACALLVEARNRHAVSRGTPTSIAKAQLPRGLPRE
ncbi:MAG: hypothetical protein AAF253_14085 [Pseudomonadota bacterium]